MKKFFATTLCIVAGAVMLFGQQTSRITGNIAGLPDGTVITLALEDPSGDLLYLDKQVAADGKFVFNVSVSELGKYWLGNSSPTISYARKVWLEPGEDAIITGDGAYPYGWNVESKVERQKEHDPFHTAIKAYAAKRDSLQRQYDLLLEQQNSLQNSEMVDLFRLQTRNIEAQLEAADKERMDATVNFIKLTPVNDEVMDLMVSVSQSIKSGQKDCMEYMEDLKALYENLPQEYKSTDRGQKIYSNLFEDK